MTPSPALSDIAFLRRSGDAGRICRWQQVHPLKLSNPSASLSPSTDEALMLAYCEGDTAAFDTLYERHKGPLFRYFARQLPAAEANDCFQSVWLKLINARAGYLPSAALVNYLFTLAHNVLMDHFRVSGRLLTTDPEALEALAEAADDGAGSRTAIDEIDRRQLRDKLHTLISKLPFHQREAWLLQQESNLSQQEIAMVTATSIEGVKSRLRYARQKLKAGLKAYVRQI
jgi:RNA polymerase sigma factor (sigma-70 family)